jgi:predicted enzyme related to lactoylglutathione lyase
MSMSAPIIHIEFRSSDFTRTAAFYAELFDWQTQHNASSTYMKLEAGEDGMSGGWIRAELSQAPGPLAYIAVDDLAAKMAEVEKAGGRVIVPHMPFAGGGEIGLFADPDGNVIGLWMRKEKPAGSAAPAAKTAAPAAAAPAKPVAGKAAAPAKAPVAKALEKKPKKR